MTLLCGQSSNLHKGATTGGVGGVRTPNFLGDPLNFLGDPPNFWGNVFVGGGPPSSQ